MTKDNILKVATKEFSIYGYDAVSMNKLASKLEVNKATIYYHFKDKKSLYQEILQSLIQLNQEKNEAIANSDIPAEEKFRQYIKLFIHTIKENPEIVPIALREMANLGGNLEDSISSYLEKEMLYLKNIVLQLNLKEKYKHLDFYELKGLIMGTINTYYSMQMSNIKATGLKDLDKNSDKILDYLCEFITSLLLDALCEDNNN